MNFWCELDVFLLDVKILTTAGMAFFAASLYELAGLLGGAELAPLIAVCPCIGFWPNSSNPGFKVCSTNNIPKHTVTVWAKVSHIFRIDFVFNLIIG
ncbi:MAG: hypothetical protein ACJAWD_000754 [Methylophilaceae bacterium]|jgi:hypothetical protein|tara:strand:+ start:41451 stop:41741 length:291 start_codon:yes stop_codon:yes gene_type:complete